MSNNVSGAPLRVVANSIGDWEKLSWSKVSSNKVAFKAKVNGKYIWSQNNETNALLSAQAAPIQSRETFTWGATTKSAVAEELLNNSVEVYPNPANSMLNVLVNNEDIVELTVELYNLMGKRVLVEQIQTGISYQLDISKLENGMYILKANNQRKTLL